MKLTVASRTKPLGWGLRAFLTGSHVYGEPTQDSDIDLIIFCSEADSFKLLKLADVSTKEDDDASYADRGSRSLRFGKLNLLCFHDKACYEAWRKGTAILSQKAKKTHPFTRGFACRFLDKLFKRWLPKNKRPTPYKEKPLRPITPIKDNEDDVDLDL